MKHIVSLFLLALFSASVHAEGLDAHVHGEAVLMLAYEKSSLEVEFESPAANIVGFEYQPRSEKEHKAIELAKATLKAPAKWLQFSGASCELKDSDVAFAGEKADSHGHHDHHDHKHDPNESDHGDDHGHEAKHDHAQQHKHHGHKHEKHEKHEKHAHEHKKHKGHKGHGHYHEANAHSEVIAHYQFTCKGLESLNAITLQLMQSFPGIEKIKVVWVSDVGQGSKVLKPGQNTVNFK